MLNCLPLAPVAQWIRAAASGAVRGSSSLPRGTCRLSTAVVGRFSKDDLKARIAVLADYANVTADQKLNVMGIFNVINAPQAPVVHRQMQLVLGFVSDPWDVGESIPFEVQLVDADGKATMSLKGQMITTKAPPGEQATTNGILVLNDVMFSKFGHYEFKILVNDEPFATVPLIVQQMQMPNAPA